MLPLFSLLNKAFQLLRANQEGDMSITAVVSTPILIRGEHTLRSAEIWQFTV